MCRVLLLLVALLTPIVGWGDTIRGWYAGGGYASTNVFWTEAEYGRSQTERGDADSGFIVHAGYRFNKYLAVEAGYLDGGEPTFQSVIVNTYDGLELIDIELSQKTKAIELSGIVALPFLRIWEVYGKFGASFWDATSKQTLTPATGAPLNRTVDESGIDLLMGVGVGVTIWKNLHVRFEAQAFRTKDDLMGLDLETLSDLEARFDALILEVQWRFGDNWQ